MTFSWETWCAEQYHSLSFGPKQTPSSPCDVPRTMLDASRSDVVRVYQRRRLTHKQIEPQVLFEVKVLFGAVKIGGSECSAGSHAHLPAMPSMPASSKSGGKQSLVREGGIDKVRKKSTEEFPRRAYNRLYGRVSRWVQSQDDAQLRKVWARFKLRREIGKGLLPEQKTLLRVFRREVQDLAAEDVLFMDHLLLGVERLDPAHNLHKSWKRACSKLYTHQESSSCVPED